MVPLSEGWYPVPGNGPAFISTQRNLSYWDQLHHLRLYSLEWRRERYLIIYVWRILEAQVPNPSGKHAITANTHPRRGRECIILQVSNTAPRRIQTLRYASLPIQGARLFNILPAHIRNITGCSVDVFKGQLEKISTDCPRWAPNHRLHCSEEGRIK